jgi:hypothetical protein
MFILIPLILLGASNTYSHRQQMLAERMDAETRRAEYNLHVQEFNANHPTYHKVDPNKRKH